MTHDVALSDASLPLKVGQRVLILCDDESADERFHGRLGVVAGFLPEPGQEPLVLVSVDQLGTEVFFSRELTADPVRNARRPQASTSSWGDRPT